MEAVNYVVQCEIPLKTHLSSVADKLNSIAARESLDDSRRKKISFFARQLKVISLSSFSMADYCFAIEHYPKTKYENLQEFLVLPSKSKIKTIISAAEESVVLKEMFRTVNCRQQRYCLLIIDEVKIRPTIAYSGGVLQGMAENVQENSHSHSCIHLLNPIQYFLLLTCTTTKNTPR